MKLQIICYALTSLLLGGVCFAVLGHLGQGVAVSYLETENNKTLYAAAERFQQYVAANGFNSKQWETISDFDDERVYVLSLQRSAGKENLADGRQRKTERGKVKKQSDEIQLVLPITFADGIFQTRFLYVPSKSAHLIAWLICGLVSFAIFLLTFYLLLKQKLDYIRSIESGISILESGDLRYRIDVQGKDELGRLAQSVNCMSEALTEKIVAEQRALLSGREIIGDLSHDIRTPLTILSGYLPLLLETRPLTMQQREYLELVRKKTEQMSRRVDELLDYAVIYSGQRQLAKITLAAKTLLEQLAEELTPLGAVIIDIIPAGTCIDADPSLLERVLDNVLANLHKYADLNQELRLTGEIDNGDLMLKIENTVLSTVAVDGKSLGLKITSYIMERHGGSLTTMQKADRFLTVLRFPVSGTIVAAPNRR